jgi:thymidylate synthase
MQSSYFQTKKTNKRSHWDDAGYEEPVDKKQKKDKKQDYEKQRKQKRGEE